MVLLCILIEKIYLKYTNYGNQTQSISKCVLSALLEVIEMAYLQGYKEDSKFIKRHAYYVKSLHKAKGPDAYARYMAKKVIPDEEAYTERLESTREYYKGDLLTSLEKLYEIYYEIIKTPPPEQKSPPTKDDAQEFMNKLFGKLNIL